MGNIGPSHSYGGYSSQEASAAEQRLATARRVKEEVEVLALNVFFASMDENSGRGDPSTKEGKLKQVENEVKMGTLAPEQAAGAMGSILNDFKTSGALSLPKIGDDLTTSKTQVLLHTEFFTLFLHVNAPSGIPQTLIKQSIDLADQVAGDRISPKEGAQGLMNLITQANQIVPRTLRYPEKIGPALFGL